MRKVDNHTFKGMQRDASISKQPVEFLWDARNIRLTAREGNTLFSITNEKGTESVHISGEDMIGEYVGHCVIGDSLVVFTHYSKTLDLAKSNDFKAGDRIYKMTKVTGSNKYFTSVNLLEKATNGCLDLGFDTSYPLQTLGVYENEKIQKVYWTDGKKQPRVINIVNEGKAYINTSFDFVPEMTLNDYIRVNKIADSSGIFGAGVIQYYVSYYNKYGQESNISLASQLIPTSFTKRAGSPEERIGNSFRVTVYNVDQNFEYMRIYSMFRSSKDATPTCKRVADIPIGSTGSLSIVDNGTIGDTIDPQELLYIGGEEIKAGTMEQKDGTLFLGDIEVTRPQISSLKTDIQNDLQNDITSTTRAAYIPVVHNDHSYWWSNSLCARVGDDTYDYNVSTAGFKYKEHYRLGIQFQYKTGKWSEPVYGLDMVQTQTPSIAFGVNKDGLADSSIDTLRIPIFKAYLQPSTTTKLKALGYKRARAVVVFPTMQDRLIQAQGMLSPTVYSVGLRKNNAPYSQSSWFFRPWLSVAEATSDDVNESYISEGSNVEYRNNYTLYGFNNRGAEIQGVPMGWGGKSISSIFSKDDSSVKINVGNNPSDSNQDISVKKEQCVNVFCVDQSTVTMHSPEFEFDDSFASLDLSTINLKECGLVSFISNKGTIDIQTETPCVGAKSTGFYKKSLTASTASRASRRLCAGLFYKDYMVDCGSDGKGFVAWNRQKHDFSFMVYPWQRSTSLNNDCNRPSGEGTRTAMLSTKKISNIRFGDTTYLDDADITSAGSTLVKGSKFQLFNSDQVSLLKVDGNSYYGNVDLLLTVPASYGFVFSPGKNFTSLRGQSGVGVVVNDDLSISIYKAQQSEFDDPMETAWATNNTTTNRLKGVSPNTSWDRSYSENDFQDGTSALTQSVETIRMKYKSTPHLVAKLDDACTNPSDTARWKTKAQTSSSLYMAELYRNANKDTDFGGYKTEALQANLWYPAGEAVILGNKDHDKTEIEYSWGDTWYQRYDCMKTYPYTNEDPNQVVEIASFMVETHTNLDGRYDRNRGMDDNLNMSPTNFNLINTVYSQLDNFFNYRIMDEDYYKLTNFPSMVTWTGAKNNASDVDSWTTVTLASTLEIDGTLGKISALATSKDTLYAFQEKGITQILFNSRVMVSSSDNVPIEISNNYKVDGNRYISTAVGCKDKFSLTKAPMGIYFIDNISKALYLLSGDQLQNISDTHGMGYWFSTIDSNNLWCPMKWREYYSSSTHEFEKKKWELDSGVALYYDFNNKDLYVSTKSCTLCYSELLGQFVSFHDYQGGILFNIGNSFHALTSIGSLYDGSTYHDITRLWTMFEGYYNTFFYQNLDSYITFISNLEPTVDKIFTNLECRMDRYDPNGDLRHWTFLDYIKVTDEYQSTDKVALVPGLTKTNHTVISNTKKKFRIWRCDIPRNWGSRDRIRNTWCKVSLYFEATVSDTGKCVAQDDFELHDVAVVYYT